MEVSKSSANRRAKIEPPEPSRGAARSSWLALVVVSAALAVMLLSVALAFRSTLAPEVVPKPASTPRGSSPDVIEAQFPENEPDNELVRPIEALERSGFETGLESEVDAESPEDPDDSAPRAREAHLQSARLSIDVVDESGRLIADAHVEILTVDDGSSVERRLVRSTNAEGRVEIATPAGWCEVVAWSSESAGGPLDFELAAGVTERTTLVLRPSLAVAGRIVDERTGAPIPNARVFFWTFSEKDIAVTAADGTFYHPRFPAESGAQQVRVEAPGYGSAVRYLDVSSKGWRLVAAYAETRDSVGTGEPWIEIPLAPELLVRGTVRGTLHGRAGVPLAGAQISAEGFFRVLPNLASRDGSVTQTDEDGHFVLPGLRSDVSHALHVTAPLHAAHTIELAATSEPLEIDIALQVEALLSGVVVDPDGLPAEGIEVTLHRTDVHEEPPDAGASTLDAGARIEGRFFRLRTSSEGTFEFTSLEPGDYVVQIAGDLELLLEKSVIVGNVASPPSLELRLPPKSLVLIGEVRGDYGAIPNARIDVRREGFVSSVVADEQGHFRVAGLDSAQYELVTSGRCPRTGIDLQAVTMAWSHDRPIVRLGDL